jgi:hypothetical protein
MKEDLKSLPWYDSYWHSSYINAKTFLAQNHPEKLDDFIERFEILQTRKDYKPVLLENIISLDLHEKIKLFVKSIDQSDFKKYEFIQFGRLIKHNLPLFNEIQETLVERVSEIVGEEVEVSYNFLSLYNVLGVLHPHMDAPSAKWTLDYCIDQSDVWPIYLSKVVPWASNFNYPENWAEQVKSNPENEFREFHLTPGKAVLFGGSSQWHYRERIAKENGNIYCQLVFFHFIPKGTSELCYPEKWSSIFGIPELDQYVFGLKETTSNR